MKLAILVALLWSSTASAETAAIVVYGSANAPMRAAVKSTFTASVTELAWTLVDGAPDKAIATCAEDDNPWKCIAPKLGGKDIDRIIAISVEPDGSNVILTATLVVAGTDEPVRSREPCQSCNDTLLEGTTRNLAGTMIRHAQRFAQATLVIDAEPSSAVISVDGKAEGKGSATLSTNAGTHTIVVAHDGYITETRDVELAAGKEMSLVLALKPNESPSRPKWPLAIAGLGLAAAVTGTVISLNVDPPPADQPQPEHLYSAPGIGLAVAGGVAVVVGIYLYATSSTSGPTVSASGNGGSIGWITTF